MVSICMWLPKRFVSFLSKRNHHDNNILRRSRSLDSVVLAQSVSHHRHTTMVQTKKFTLRHGDYMFVPGHNQHILVS